MTEKTYEQKKEIAEMAFRDIYTAIDDIQIRYGKMDRDNFVSVHFDDCITVDGELFQWPSDFKLDLKK